MRDESIQTAEASVTAANNHEQRTTVIALSDVDGDNTITWQDYITPPNDVSGLNGIIEGKTATASKPLLSRFNTKLLVNAPSLAEFSGNTAAERLPLLSETIHAYDKQDTHKASTPPKNPAEQRAKIPKR